MGQNPLPVEEKRFDQVDETRSARIAAATALLVRESMARHPDTQDSLRIALHGGLGAGKTTWVRHFLRALGVKGRIKSPSFSVAETYESDGLHLHHLDFYRESNPLAWQSSGFRDLLAERSVVLMEWPEKVAGLPPSDIDVQIGWTSQTLEDAPRTMVLRFHPHSNDLDFNSALPAWRNALIGV